MNRARLSSKQTHAQTHEQIQVIAHTNASSTDNCIKSPFKHLHACLQIKHTHKHAQAHRQACRHVSMHMYVCGHTYTHTHTQICLHCVMGACTYTSHQKPPCERTHLHMRTCTCVQTGHNPFIATATSSHWRTRRGQASIPGQLDCVVHHHQPHVLGDHALHLGQEAPV